MTDTPQPPLVDPATVRTLTAAEYDATYADAKPHPAPDQALFAELKPAAGLE